MDLKEGKISLSIMLKEQALEIDLNEDWDLKKVFWDPLPEISGSFLGTLLFVTAVFGLLTSIVCYIYITFLLRINEINQLLLKWYAIELISCFITIIIQTESHSPFMKPSFSMEYF